MIKLLAIAVQLGQVIVLMRTVGRIRAIAICEMIIYMLLEQTTRLEALTAVLENAFERSRSGML